MNTRRGIAAKYGIAESKIRFWEQSGALPIIGAVPIGEYRRRLWAIVAARENGLSMQRVRRALERRGRE